MKISRNLSLQLTLATAAFAVLMAMAISGFQMLKERRKVFESIAAQFDQIQSLAVPSLAEAVWSINLDVIRLTAGGIANQAGVNYVAVTGLVDNKVEFGDHVQQAALHEFSLYRKRGNERHLVSVQPIGTLSVEINQPAIEQLLAEKYRAIFFSNLLLITLVAGFVLFLLEQRVIRPIRKIARFVDSRDTGNLDKPLTLRRRNLGGLGLDEVNMLSDGVSRMQENLRAAIEQLRADIGKRETAEAQVRSLNTELERRVESRTEQLREAQAAAEQVLDMTESAYWQIDLNSNLIVANDRLERLLGIARKADHRYSKRQHLYGPIVAADPSTAARLRAATEAAVARDQAIVHGEVPYKRPDGTVIWMSIVGRSSYAPDGSVTISGSMQNITWRKATEDALQEARRVAESASQAKADFLANMSHEIRTPMNAIYGMSHLMLKTDLTARQRDYLNKIQQAGEYLLGIINDILDFSKIEAGKLSVENTEFDIDTVLQNVVNLIGGKASQKGLELIFDLPPEVPSVLWGDPLRLGQILINFGNNAVKFTERGEIRIVLRVLERSETDAVIYFGIKDTGIGLAPEQISRLFQSFEQADASTTRKYGGTGLGLVICRRLAELMGGQVGVESQTGMGSTFWLTLPLKISTTPRRILLPQQSLQGMRILLVDDNQMALQSTAEMLTQMSFDVDKATSGAAAVAAVREAQALGRPYALVMVDWLMPGMDGIETVRRIRNLQVNPLPQFVIATAHGREEVIHLAHAAGIDTVLIKPTSASMMFDTLIQVLGGSQGDAARAAPGPLKVLASLAAIRGARILVADDNLINQQIAREILLDAGLQVDVADNGQVAMAMLEAGNFDLVLMDMHMPVLGGIEATELIRRQARFAALPIIAMTANVMQADRDRCKAAGMNDFVAKPIEPDDLFRALLAWIATREVAPDLPVNLALTAASDASFPLSIAGIDLEVGLHRVMGKKSRFMAILRNFCETQANAALQIKAALQADVPTDAERLAHTVKGLAGQIAAHSLQSVAGQLEALIAERAVAAVVEERLLAFSAALATQVAAIHQAIGPPAGISGSSAAGEAATSFDENVVGQLLQLLRNDDAKADRFLAEHANLLMAQLPEQFRALRQAVSEYDFELALSLLPADSLAAIDNDDPGLQ